VGTKEKNRKEAEVSGKLEASALATALALCAKGEHKRAAYVLLPRISRAEADPEEHRLLVSCYLELGNPTEALARAEAISGRGPDDIVLAGRCLLALGRWDDAATRFARGFRIVLTRAEPVILVVTHGLAVSLLREAAAGQGFHAHHVPVPYARPFEFGADELAQALERLEAWQIDPRWSE